MKAFRTRCNLLRSALLIFLSLLAAALPAAETVTYYHTDALGSIVAATDEQGAVLWRESYRPYGERIDRTVPTSDHRLFYTGKPHDDATGFTYFGARYYDPLLGRFIGMDPALGDPANPQMFSRYAYANNNPYKYVDPDGAWPLAADAFRKGQSLEQSVQNNAPMMAALGLTEGFLGLYTAVAYSPTLVVLAEGIPPYFWVGLELGALSSGEPLGRGFAARGAGTALKDFSSVATRTTRGGGQGVRLTRPDGSVLDITGKRVKEFVPNTHPNAPPGTLQRVRFPKAQPGTKGFKRDPTPDELRLLDEAFK